MAFPLVPAKLAQLSAGEGACSGWSCPPDIVGRGFEVDLLTAQVDRLGRPRSPRPNPPCWTIAVLRQPMHLD